jgi:hypothetical protein
MLVEAMQEWCPSGKPMGKIMYRREEMEMVMKGG